MSDSAGAPQQITQLLLQDDLSEEAKNHQLLSLVYVELKRMARYRMLSERSNHTLTPTALVHEVYLKLVQAPDLGWQSRRHFFAAAAESMRRILIDSARARASLKRGAGADHTSDPDQYAEGVQDSASEMLDLDRALSLLETRDSLMSEVVKLRYFAGLTTEETAQAMQISVRTANRIWAAARAWLITQMAESAVSQDTSDTQY